MKIEDCEAAVPIWAKKHTKRKLPNGVIVGFAGKNPNHMSIVVIDPSTNSHFTLTIKPDAYELHRTNEKTGQKTPFFNLHAPVITQLLEHWWGEHHKWVKPFTPKYWNEEDKKYSVIDINSSSFPDYLGRKEIYDMDPSDVKRIAMDRKDIIGMKFKIGAIFDHNGRCKGLLLAARKKKKLIRVESQLFKKIIDTAIGIDNLVSTALED